MQLNSNYPLINTIPYLSNTEPQAETNSEMFDPPIKIPENREDNIEVTFSNLQQTSVEFLNIIETEWKTLSRDNLQQFYKHFEAKLPACLAAFEKQPDLWEEILIEIFSERLIAFGGDFILADLANPENEEGLAIQEWQKAIEDFLLSDNSKDMAHALRFRYLLDLVTTGTRLHIQKQLFNRLVSMDPKCELEIIMTVQNPISKEDLPRFCDLFEKKMDSFNFEAREICRKRMLEWIKEDPRTFDLYNKSCVNDNKILDDKDVAYLNNHLKETNYSRESREFALNFVHTRLKNIPHPNEKKLMLAIRKMAYQICLHSLAENEDKENLIEKVLFILCKTTPKEIDIEDLFPETDSSIQKKI